MIVVGRSVAYNKVRAVRALAGVVAAVALLAPAGAAPGEQPGYRRLVELESARTFSDELTAALASADAGLAGRAALALGRTEDSRAAGPLKNATSAKDVSLRALAMYGYGLLAAKNPIETDTVAKALADPAGPVRIAGVDAAWRAYAGKAPGAAALSRRLLVLTARDPDPIVRARAGTALSAWSDAADRAQIGRQLVSAFARERDATVRWHEAWALRRAFATVADAATIRAGLADRDELVRIQFADLVARRKQPQALPQMQPLLKDPSWRVREQAYETIKVLAGLQRTDHLGAIPAEIATPPPSPPNTEAPLPRPTGLGPARKPVPADARLDLALRPSTSALMDGPMPGPHPRVRIGTTKGTIVVRLYPEWAPLTVANFLNLVDRGYYDNLRWFRIVPDFVVQTGDPHDDGEGDAGYMIPAEENPLEQRSGVISMGLNYTDPPDAHAIRDSAGTQFYITLSPQLHLDKDFTVFGEVESGFSVLGRLVELDRMTRVERLADD
jgi:peptidyl-prolyl cis-trans isomerase B (cyclophilin B)